MSPLVLSTLIFSISIKASYGINSMRESIIILFSIPLDDTNSIKKLRYVTQLLMFLIRTLKVLIQIKVYLYEHLLHRVRACYFQRQRYDVQN